MAIHDQDNNNSSAPDLGAATSNAGQAAPQQPAENSNRMKLGFGLSNSNLGFMPTSMGGEYTEAWAESLKKLYKRQETVNTKIIKIDDGTLAYNCLVVCMNAKTEPSKVAYHVLLLAATGTPPSRVAEINTDFMLNPPPGKRPEFPRIPSDAFDEVLMNVVRERVVQAYVGIKDVTFFQTDGVVIPVNMDPSNESEIWLEVANAGNACYWELVLNRPDFGDLNVGEAMSSQQGIELTIDIRAERGTLMNEVHKPIRHSFVTELVTQSLNRRVQSINLNNDREVVTRVVGFTDFIPVPQTVNTSTGLPANIFRFRPHLIFNSINAQVSTPGFLMLALAMGFSTYNNDVWLNTIRPVENDPIHDPGVLNYLANLEGNKTGVGERVDFFASGLSAYEVTDSLRKFFIPGVVVSVDVDVFGPQTWFTSILSSAAVPGKNQNAAIRAVVAACDVLTGGRFSARFNGNIFDNVIQIPTGTWIDKNGVERDLRDIDFLAVSDFMGPENTRGIHEWALASLNSGINNIAATAKRLEIIKQIAPDAVIEGAAMRLTFSAAFQEALTGAIAESGFAANMNAANVITGMGDLATVGDYMASSVVTSTNMPFARTSNGYQGAHAYWSVPGAGRQW
jgi:hypothetical protein